MNAQLFPDEHDASGERDDDSDAESSAAREEFIRREEREQDMLDLESILKSCPVASRSVLKHRPCRFYVLSAPGQSC